MHLSSLDVSKQCAIGDIPYLKDDDLVIFGGWEPETYPVAIRRTKAKKAILWTSSFGQAELSNNQIEISWFDMVLNKLKNKQLDYLLIGSKEMYEIYKEVEGVKQFMYPFNPSMYNNYRPMVRKIPWSIGMFLPNAPRKNILNQKMAFKLLKRKYNEFALYENISSGYIPDNEFYPLMGSMEFNLHCTHTESFGYNVCESLALGALSIVSPVVRDNLCLINDICVDNIDSPISIAEKISTIIDNTVYDDFLSKCQNHISTLAERNNKDVKKLLVNFE